MISPYIIGSPVTGVNFYGRQRLIETILDGPNRNLWIIGNRRVGKTSLLREIEQRTANNTRYLPLYWDMSGCETETKFTQKLYYYIREAQRGADSRWDTFVPLTTTSLPEALWFLAQWTEDKHLQLLLLCDEAEGLLYLAEKTPVTLQELRDVLQNHSAIRPVLASTRRLSRLYDQCDDWDTSLFLDGFAPYPLAHFRDETANQVITQAQSPAPLQVTDTLLANIRQATNNHPLLLQRLCHTLFDDEQSRLRMLAPADITLDVQVAGLFQIDFNALTLDEAKLLQHIGLSSSALSELEKEFTNLNVPSLLRNLIESSLVRCVANTYTVGNVFLAEWLKTAPTQPPKGGITNRMQRQVTQARVTSLQQQLLGHYRRLGKLQEQRALKGANTPPEILIEIEDCQQQIALIEVELTALGHHPTHFQLPQAD